MMNNRKLSIYNAIMEVKSLVVHWFAETSIHPTSPQKVNKAAYLALEVALLSFSTDG